MFSNFKKVILGFECGYKLVSNYITPTRLLYTDFI